MSMVPPILWMDLKVKAHFSKRKFRSFFHFVAGDLLRTSPLNILITHLNYPPLKVGSVADMEAPEVHNPKRNTPGSFCISVGQTQTWTAGMAFNRVLSPEVTKRTLSKAIKHVKKIQKLFSPFDCYLLARQYLLKILLLSLRRDHSLHIVWKNKLY